jgi:serine/threonine protein kinase
MLGHVIGNYKVIEKIGEGGMGEVFLGRDMLLERDVAIKSLRPEYSRRHDIVERFRTEAVALARLNHPNIAMLYNYIVHNNQYYMILEFVRGERLDNFLTRRSPVPWLEVFSIISQILQGLDHAHRLGIIHRDIKPSNLMSTLSGRLKIMDFGIARILQSTRLTRTGQMIGTLEYMSPEQIKGLETDARTDVYSTGIVAYEMLTGRPPFQRNTDYELIKSQIEEQPMDIRDIRSDIPDCVASIIARSLEKDPDKRFSSANDFMAAIEDVSANSISGDPAIHHIGSGPDTRIMDVCVSKGELQNSTDKSSELNYPPQILGIKDLGGFFRSVFMNRIFYISLFVFGFLLLIPVIVQRNSVSVNTQNPAIVKESVTPVTTEKESSAREDKIKDEGIGLGDDAVRNEPSESKETQPKKISDNTVDPAKNSKTQKLRNNKNYPMGERNNGSGKVSIAAKTGGNRKTILKKSSSTDGHSDEPIMDRRFENTENISSVPNPNTEQKDEVFNKTDSEKTGSYSSQESTENKSSERESRASSHAGQSPF